MNAALAIVLSFVAAGFAGIASAADEHAGHDHGAPAVAASAVPMSDGVIRRLDVAAASITIAHGEIANLHMSPMTMTFKAKTPAMLKRWKEGDKIRFRAEDIKGELTVTRIDAAK